MRTITRLNGIAGAHSARGATVVIDTFRAFTTAAVLLDAGVTELLLVDGVDEARKVAGERGALLAGEEDGVMPPGFDLGNSPFEVTRRTDLRGSVVVLRTSSGTRAVLAAVGAGAGPVFAGSLVVASATAAAITGHDHCSIVSAGLAGVGTADEDDLTGDLIVDLLERSANPHANVAAIRATPRAAFLAATAWAHPEDVEIACDVDRFHHAMLATPLAGGLVRIVAVDPVATD